MWCLIQARRSLGYPIAHIPRDLRLTPHVDAAPRSAAPSAPRRPAAPSAVFLPLFSPFGISSGYVGVTLAFLLARAGLSTLEVTTIVAGTIWVQTWKVLWAPIVDTVGNPKLWYGLGATGVGASILAMSVLPVTAGGVPVITLLALLSSAASTLVSMSSEIFMAQSVPAESRGAPAAVSSSMAIITIAPPIPMNGQTV